MSIDGKKKVATLPIDGNGNKSRMIGKRTEMVVTKSFGKSGAFDNEESDSKSIKVHKFQTTPAMVTVRYGLTLNLGNYESARVDVEVSVPCYKEEIDDAYVFVEKFVEDKVISETQKIKQPDKN